MKRFVLILAAFAACAFAPAELTTGEIMEKIAGAKARKTVIDCGFKEVRTSPAGSEVKLDGRLVYKPDNYLSMEYSNGELFLIDGSRMTIRRDGKENVFDLDKNLMMKSLSHALLYSFRGTLVDLSVEQKTLINAVLKDGCYVVSLCATKPSARGYNRIDVYYDASTYAIKAMRMDEFSGASTYYSM